MVQSVEEITAELSRVAGLGADLAVECIPTPREHTGLFVTFGGHAAPASMAALQSSLNVTAALANRLAELSLHPSIDYIVFTACVNEPGQGLRRFMRVGLQRAELLAHAPWDADGVFVAGGRSAISLLLQDEGQLDRYAIDLAAKHAEKGKADRAHGDLDRAEHEFFTALRLARDAHDDGMRASILCNLGMVFEDQKKYAQAERLHLDALQIDETLNNDPGVANHCANLGRVRHALGHLEQANQMLDRALELYRRLGNQAGERYVRRLRAG